VGLSKVNICIRFNHSVLGQIFSHWRSLFFLYFFAFNIYWITLLSVNSAAKSQSSTSTSSHFYCAFQLSLEWREFHRIVYKKRLRSSKSNVVKASLNEVKLNHESCPKRARKDLTTCRLALTTVLLLYHN